MCDEWFEWHDRKARTNVRDHGVTFEEATKVFDDVHAVDDIDTSMDYGEERSIIIGMAAYDKLLVVVYVMKGERIRIISAREADRHEQRKYYRQGG